MILHCIQYLDLYRHQSIPRSMKTGHNTCVCKWYILYDSRGKSRKSQSFGFSFLPVNSLPTMLGILIRYKNKTK